MPYIFSKCHTLRAVSPAPQVPPIPGHRGRTLAADVNPGSPAGSTGAWDEMQWKRYQYSWHRDRPCVAMDLIGAPITPPHDSARPGRAGSGQGGATGGASTRIAALATAQAVLRGGHGAAYGAAGATGGWDQ